MRILEYSTNVREVLALAARRSEPDREVATRVREILETVRREGEEAVTTYTRQFDCRFIDSLGLRVSEREINSAHKLVKPGFLKSLRVASRNITRFHKKQFPVSWTLRDRGLVLRQRFLPLGRVGIYVPGGKAAYPSTVLMNALPARIAGVKEVVMVTPCNSEGKIVPEVLVAAAESGVTEIYRIGGAQAIAALAYGTESIRRVDKITGPGNAYVAAAKQMVFGLVGVDSIAGPTEVVVVADEKANPAFVAADLIAQAEHDESASPICITTSHSLAGRINNEVGRQLERTSRKNVAQRAFDQNGVIILVSTLPQAAEIVNSLAPEHLEVMVKNPGRFAERITTAGSIFLGEWATEALGDYVAGPNHTLPTMGTARFSSALSVYDFMRFTNIIDCTQKHFRTLAPHVEVLAEAEGLHGHAASVRLRRGRK